MLPNRASSLVDYHLHAKSQMLLVIKIIGGGLLVLLLTLIGLFMVAPASPPQSSDISYPEVILVSENQRTYLEVELENYTDEAEHTQFVMNLYFTQLGGWFESTKRTLLYKQNDFNTSDRVQFTRLGTGINAPFKVNLPNNTKGVDGGYFIFTPPATYRQTQLVKPTIVHY
jgi:hypothetical protein